MSIVEEMNHVHKNPKTFTFNIHLIKILLSFIFTAGMTPISKDVVHLVPVNLSHTVILRKNMLYQIKQVCRSALTADRNCG